MSTDLLDDCRRTAAGDERCSFLRASAEDLTGVADASVDAVTTRSVLIYCTRKADAFAEFFRVLRPGGRLAIFEPINSFPRQHRPGDLLGLAGSPVDDLIARMVAVLTGDDPRVDFDERDLLAWAEGAGFTAVELDYRAQLDVPAPPLAAWSQLKHTAPNPLAPTYAEAMAAALDEEERARLDAYLSSSEHPPTRRTMAVAYLRATVPDQRSRTETVVRCFEADLPTSAVDRMRGVLGKRGASSWGAFPRALLRPAARSARRNPRPSTAGSAVQAHDLLASPWLADRPRSSFRPAGLHRGAGNAGRGSRRAPARRRPARSLAEQS